MYTFSRCAWFASWARAAAAEEAPAVVLGWKAEALMVPDLEAFYEDFLNLIWVAGIAAARCLDLISCTLSRLSKLPPII